MRRFRSTPTRRLLLLSALCAISLVGCDTGDGTTLRPPPEGVAAPLPTPSTELTLPADTFAIASPVFSDQGLLPSRHTLRDGQNVSPPLRWAGAPDGTAELALVVTDVAASAAVHWVLAGLEATSVGVEEGQVPPGAVQAQNDFGIVGWTGPASDDGRVHTYRFTLHALSEPVGLETGTLAPEMVARIDALTIATAEVAALYE